MNEERPCPVCESKRYTYFADRCINEAALDKFSYSSRKQPEFMCFRLVRCMQCDLIYAPSPPSSQSLQHAYASAAFDTAEEADAAAKSYAKVLDHYCSRLTSIGAAVDVGAGSGALLPFFVEKGFAPVVGIEPSLAAIQAAKAEVAPMLRQGMFTVDMLGDLRASVICSCMTLEHIDNPKDFINTAFKSLLPGGMVAVIVHDWRAPLNKLLGTRSPIIDIEHLQLFSKKSLLHLLASAGFKDIQQKTITNTYPLRYWLRLAPLPVLTKKRIQNSLIRLRLSDAHLTLPVGNRLAIGLKPEF